MPCGVQSSWDVRITRGDEISGTVVGFQIGGVARWTWSRGETGTKVDIDSSVSNEQDKFV
jgi:hypothetical protein